MASFQVQRSGNEAGSATSGTQARRAGKPSPRRQIWILDFDGTITMQDTIDNVLIFGGRKQEERGDPSSVEYLKACYAEDYRQHTASAQRRSTLAEEIAFQRSLREVEQASLDRISQSGIFEGITPAQWRDYGYDCVQCGLVKMRPGFRKFVTRLKTEGELHEWAILSVNFSGEFIRGVLDGMVGDVSALSILANRPQTHHGRFSLEGQEGLMCTSEDKLLALYRLGGSQDPARLAIENSKAVNREGGVRLVYVGDSKTDIECLTRPEVVGVIVSEGTGSGKSELFHTLDAIGIEVVHISNYRDTLDNCVYWAANFEEIRESPLLIPEEETRSN